MTLSQAIEKREQLKARATAAEKWYQEQRFGNAGELKWREVIMAISKAIDEMWSEHNELNEAIEKAIAGVEFQSGYDYIIILEDF